MEKSEFAKIFGILRHAYPYYFKDMSNAEKTEFAEVWYGFFRRDEIKTLVNAIQSLVVKSKFMPSIHDIKAEMALCADPGLQVSATAEWDKVIRGIRSYGVYREQEALNSFCEATHDIVRSIGWKRLCMSTDDDIEWRKKDFCEMYQDKKYSHKTSIMLGGSQKDDDGRMQGLVKKIGGNNDAAGKDDAELRAKYEELYL